MLYFNVRAKISVIIQNRKGNQYFAPHCPTRLEHISRNGIILDYSTNSSKRQTSCQCRRNHSTSSKNYGVNNDSWQTYQRNFTIFLYQTTHYKGGLKAWQIISKAHLIERVRRSRFGIQLDETTDVTNQSVLLWRMSMKEPFLTIYFSLIF